jgi:hypothetical protein
MRGSDIATLLFLPSSVSPVAVSGRRDLPPQFGRRPRLPGQGLNAALRVLRPLQATSPSFHRASSRGLHARGK